VTIVVWSLRERKQKGPHTLQNTVKRPDSWYCGSDECLSSAMSQMKAQQKKQDEAFDDY